MPQRFVLALSCAFLTSVQAQEARFSILRGSQVIGSILATCTATGPSAVYRMASFSAFDLIVPQEVRSMVMSEQHDGKLRECLAWMKVNGQTRDSSHFEMSGNTVRCYVHPNKRSMIADTVRWTTSRMYFEEPLDRSSIFVESVLQHCPLECTGPGTYLLRLPGSKVNRYVYRNGRLEEIQVDRALFDLVFRRN